MIKPTKRLLEVETLLKELEDEKRNILQCEAVKACPYSIGDVVTSHGDFWSGNRCTITRITYTKVWGHDYDYTWNVGGQTLDDDDNYVFDVAWTLFDEEE